MKRSVLRILTIIVVLTAWLVPTVGLAFAPQDSTLPGEQAQGYFVFSAQGHRIPTSDARECIEEWADRELGDLALTLRILHNGMPLENESCLSTGDLIRFEESGVPVVTYGAVVRGDVRGTGRTGLSQIVALAQVIKGEFSASDMQLAAADIDGSAAIGLADLVQAAGYLAAPAPAGPVLATEPQSELEAAESYRPVPEVIAPVGEATAAPTYSASQETTAPADAAIPEYNGNAWSAVNGNVPYFDVAACAPDSWEEYAALDELGRCGPAFACIGWDVMPTATRAPISEVTPSGWQSVKYPGVVPGEYLYNRCHLIGFQLTAEDANPYNLITGTRYLNVEGMLPFENMIADYVRETGNHVLYRATPVFSGSELVARGVLLEAASVEDAGADILFCVFVHNVQPGIAIDYATGASMTDGTSPVQTEASVQPISTQVPQQTATPASPQQTAFAESEQDAAICDYVLNTNTHKFHLPSCSSVKKIQPANRRNYAGTRESVIALGYAACKICCP